MNIIIRTGLLLFIFLTINSRAFSQQNASIEGVVHDISLGERMIGANVYLEGTSIGSITNTEGEFIIHRVPKGEYVLKVSYIGYVDYTESITVSSNEVLKRNINLDYKGSFDLEQVVITAQAKGQYKAINEQLNASSMKNVVSAERIQELPDANAAEVLGRLPGITLERSGGEGQKVVIRGLSPKYTKVMINGIEMPSNSSGFSEYRNEVTTDRSTNLSMISPFSLGSIEVIKSPTAEQDADFIGGIVNFKLRTAPKGLKVEALAEGSYNNLKNTYNDYNLNASVSNRFLNDKFGLFVQANAEQRNRSSNEVYFQLQGRQFDVSDNYNDSISPYNPVDSTNKQLNDVLRTTKRYGATVVFDYIIPNGKLVFSNIFNSSPSRIASHQESYGIPYYDNQQNFAMHLTDAVSNNNTTILSNSLQYEQTISSFDLDASFSHALSSSENTINTLNSHNIKPPDSGDPKDPEYVYYPLLNTGVGSLNNDVSINEQQQFELAANISWNFLINQSFSGKIKAGGKIRKRDKSFDMERMQISLGDAGSTNIRLEALSYFSDIKEKDGNPFYYEDITDDNYEAYEFLKGDYVLGPRAMVDFIEDFPGILVDNGFEDQRYYNYGPISQLNDYFGDEMLEAAYILSEINITKKFTMIPGVRFEKNTTTYTSYTGENQFILAKTSYTIDTSSITRKNTFLLPSLQLKYEPLTWLQLRFGYSNTLARPGYNALLPRTVYYPSSTPKYVDSKNRELKPEESENLDFIVSFKQNYIGLFTVGAFSKDIKNKIFRMPRTYMPDPSIYNLDPYYVTLYGTNQIATDANNTNLTKVRGLEFDWQTSFWYLPGALKGLVLNTNYTYTHSEAVYVTNRIENRLDPITFMPIITNDSAFYTDRLFGQAAHSLNVSLGYDYKGFSARVSMNYISDISRGVSRYPELRSYSLPLNRWDISIKQSLPLPGLQVYANFNNISSAIEKNIKNKVVQLPQSSYYYGSTISLGVRWRMQ